MSTFRNSSFSHQPTYESVTTCTKGHFSYSQEAYMLTCTHLFWFWRQCQSLIISLGCGDRNNLLLCAKNCPLTLWGPDRVLPSLCRGKNSGFLVTWILLLQPRRIWLHLTSTVLNGLASLCRCSCAWVCFFLLYLMSSSLLECVCQRPFTESFHCAVLFGWTARLTWCIYCFHNFPDWILCLMEGGGGM